MDELEKQLHELRENQTNMRALIENIAEQVWSVDRSLRLMVFNSYFLENPYLNKKKRPQEKKPISQYWLPEYAHMWDGFFLEALSGKSFSVELALEDHFYEVSFRPIWTEKKEVVGVTTCFREVTDRRLAHQNLIEAKELAEHTSKTKSKFLTNMSHELRTPLNAIIGYSEMLFDALDEGGSYQIMKEDVDKIHKAGKHLLALIEEILDLTRIEAGKLDLHISKVNLPLLLEEISSVAESFMEEKHNTFEWSIASHVEEIQTDETTLRQILLHLLSNAAKFTSEGKVKLSVEPHLNGQEPWLKFQIADTGIGIPQNQQAQIFEYFTQIDMAPSRKEGGTGIGLAITRRFCEALGGTITVQSEEGTGTLFTVLLPCSFERPRLLR